MVPSFQSKAHAMTLIVMAAVWKSMYAQSGIFNTLLLTVGLDAVLGL